MRIKTEFRRKNQLLTKSLKHTQFLEFKTTAFAVYGKQPFGFNKYHGVIYYLVIYQLLSTFSHLFLTLLGKIIIDLMRFLCHTRFESQKSATAFSIVKQNF